MPLQSKWMKGCCGFGLDRMLNMTSCLNEKGHHFQVAAHGKKGKALASLAFFAVQLMLLFFSPPIRFQRIQDAKNAKEKPDAK